MMSDRPTLTIAYSTLPSRLNSITYPENRDDREVLVLVQNSEESSYAFTERSAKLVELKNRGVAKSRNAALDRASGEFLLFGDDDMKFIESGIDQALEYFRNNPDCSIILGQAVDQDGALRKNYESARTPLKLTNSARAATYEMLVRVDALRDKQIRFDENFGAGAVNYLGDEYILIADALRAGLKGVHLPVKIGSIPKIALAQDGVVKRIYQLEQRFLQESLVGGPRFIGRHFSFARIIHGPALVKRSVSYLHDENLRPSRLQLQISRSNSSCLQSGD